MTGSGSLARIARCLLVLGLVWPGFGPSDLSAQSRDVTARLDLAAAVLSPVDLVDLGLAGFQLDEGTWIDWLDGYDIVSEAIGVDDRVVEDAFSVDAGYRYGYDNRVGIAPGNDRVSIEVRSTLLQFASAEESESAVLALTDAVDTDLATDAIVGEWGERWFTYADTSSYVVVFQRDLIVAQLTLSTDFLDSTAYLGVLAARTSVMASTLLGNIEFALDRDDSALGLTVLRFDPEEPENTPITDRYRVSRGRFIPYLGSDVTYIDFNDLEIDAFGIITGYERFLIPATEDGLIVRILIQEHSSPELAASYVPFMRDRLTFGFGYSRVEWLEDLDLPGDTAVAYTYEIQYFQDTAFTGTAVAAQVGVYSISIEVDGPDGVDSDVVIALAEAQLTCLAGGRCEPVPYPGSDLQPDDDRSPDLISRYRHTV